jgi:hypothetical protein
VAELGDVIQFGAEPVAAGGKAVTPAPSAIYWHGYLHAVQTDSLLIRGPYPGPGEAFAAAQQALLTQIHGQRGRDTDAQPGGPARPATPLTPAQPPATVSVAFHDDAATVGDPAHGWLVVPAEHLLAAMAHPPGQLAALLREGGPRLTGREPLLTLAALTARHVGHLQPSPLYAPAPPAAAPQVPQQDAPRLPSPPAAPGAQPPHGWAPPSGPSREAGV